jgi:hypothetical protein
MATALFSGFKELLLGGDIQLDADTIKVALLDTGTPDTGIKGITGATNATPIVITATGHGFVNGDRVLIGAVGGNANANGVFQIKSVATNTFELVNEADGTTNIAGSGAYTSGGYAICLGPSAAGDFWNDFDGAVVGTPQTLGSKTITAGAFDAADPSFTAVTGATVEVLAYYKDTGSAATSPMIGVDNGATNLPITPNGGDVNVVFSSGVNRIFRL